MSKARQPDDLTELRAALRADAAAVAEALLGAPNKTASSPSTLRWGGKGSMSLELRGPKQGLWFDHECDAGSDLLGLILHARGCSFPDAVAWARQWTGLTLGRAANDDGQDAERLAQQEADRRTRLAEQAARDAAETALQDANRIGTAQGIAAACVPLAGTLAEYYLKQNRGIAPGPHGWPDVIRFHPGHRALVAIATTVTGALQAVQRVHLDEEGGKVGEAEMTARRIRAVKQTNGLLDGAAVRLPGPVDGPLLLAEGPETALAAWSATGFEVWAALGGVSKIVPPAGRRIVVCRDDDRRHCPSDRKLAATMDAWRKAGVSVLVVTPWAARRWDKSDLADTILVEGPDAVRARVDAALRPAGAAGNRIPVAEARARVATAVGGFFDRVNTMSADLAEWQRRVAEAKVDAADRAPPLLPPSPDIHGWDRMTADEQWGAVIDAELPKPDPQVFTHGVRVDVGVGKSHEARVRAADLLVAMRARGDARTVVLAVPFHALGDEQTAAFMALPAAQAAGLRASNWRGRAAPDPAAPGYSDPLIDRAEKVAMCRDLDRVHDAQEVGLKVQEAACRRRINTEEGRKWVTCPLFHRCAYQGQRSQKADLWVIAHDLLFTAKPEALGDVAVVIVDEAAWQCGLEGVHGKPMALSLAALAETAGVSDRLEFLRTRLLETLTAMPDGPISGTAMRDTILVDESAAEAIKLEWSRKVDPKMHPAMTKDERRDAKRAAEANRLIPRLSMAWNAVRALLAPHGPEASGWAELATVQRKDGPVRVLHLKGRKAIAKGWVAPTLLLDALLPVNLVRPFWPDITMEEEVLAAAPHQHVRQVTDRAYSKAMLEPLDDVGAQADPEEARRRVRNLRELRAILIREARVRAPGKVLAVLQKDVRQALADLGPLPSNLDTAHHNNIAGRDEWRDVTALIVVGRTMPSPAAVERIAEALTGRATPAPAAWYDRADASREMVDGTLLPAEADRHPDATTEAIRWQVAEGELVQIVGRARGLNRTAADPVDIIVLCDAPLPLPLAGTMTTAELAPSNGDLMWAVGGFVFDNPGHASKAYPELWATRAAAKSALQREPKLGANPYRSISIGECTQLPPIAYQVTGQGQGVARGWFDPERVTDPEAWLTDRLGVLAKCQVGDWPDADPLRPRPKPPRGDAPDPTEPEISDCLAEAEARWGPLPDSYPDEFRSAEWDDEEQPEPMEPAVIDAVHDVEGRLHPAVAYPPGLSLAPHPGVPYFDVLPIENLVRIRRRDLPDLVVSTIARPFRVLTADLAPVEQRPLLRVQGLDGLEEPEGVRLFIGWPQGSSDREKNSSGVTVALHSPVITSA